MRPSFRRIVDGVTGDIADVDPGLLVMPAQRVAVPDVPIPYAHDLEYAVARGLRSGRLDPVRRPRAAGGPGVREGGGEGVLRSPARAVTGYDETGLHRGQRFDGRSDDGFEGRAAEVQATDQGCDVTDPGQPLGMAGDVDRSGVAATGEDQ